MKNLIICLMALMFVGCELQELAEPNGLSLSNLSIECIDETAISNNTSANGTFTKHTYICRGEISGYTGLCYIDVMHDNFIVHHNHELLATGAKMPFEFTFAPEWGYLDEEHNNFIIRVKDAEENPLCKTTIVVTKHPEE